jgi:hypothetical protein
MAVGDDATNAGYPLVQETGEPGRVRWGAKEINYTRDLIAQVLAKIPLNKAGYRDKSGITMGTTDPNNANGEDGDIYFKILL